MAGKHLIGAQMFTLRDHCKTPEGIAASCREVARMGYDGIQPSAFGPIDPAELKKIMDGEGLKCAATHTNMDRIRNEIDAIIDEHHTWECSYTAIGGFHPQDEWSRDAWMRFAEEFNEAAEKFRKAGILLGYHNHSHELAPVEDGTLPLQLLIDNCSSSVWLEIDTYWIAHGGGDPAAWIDKASGRLPCVHFKDMTITPAKEQKMCEIGDGNLNWPRIIQACENAGVEWYLVERDAGDMDPFESLKISVDNMRNQLKM